jgi:tetratricopeptide (TPR) repeat protein
MKEMEADTDALKKHAEAQARLRDEARQAYQAALRLDPNNQEATRSLARLYTKMGDCERAQDIYRKALIKTPRDGTLWYDLGLCYHRKRDFPESARCFTKALELEPENRDYMKKLGFTLAWMGQYDHGLSLLTRTQGAALAHYNVARVMLQKDQTELARRYLQAALRENGQLQEARELLASIENPNANAFGRPMVNE